MYTLKNFVVSQINMRRELNKYNDIFPQNMLNKIINSTNNGKLFSFKFTQRIFNVIVDFIEWIFNNTNGKIHQFYSKLAKFMQQRSQIGLIKSLQNQFIKKINNQIDKQNNDVQRQELLAILYVKGHFNWKQIEMLNKMVCLYLKLHSNSENAF